MMDAVARSLALSALGRVRHGELQVIEGGRRHLFGDPSELIATMTIKDPRAWRAFCMGSFGLATAYVDGLWECDDLVALTRIAARNVAGLDRARGWVAPIWRPIQRAVRHVHAPTLLRSRRQIAAHYDLGNDLFELFLDETMSYSAGLFETPQTTLHEASVAKLERLCSELELRPDDHLLEIGSGWGGLAIHAASRYGCRVTTTTISREQYELASERVSAAGVADRVTVLIQDYRELAGRYDKLVSVEMIEAVGWQFFETYFRRCSELLEPHGKMLLQAITIDDYAYDVEKGGRSFINTLIFPGGCLPSRSVIERCLTGATDMRALRVQDMTPDYVRTIQCWRERFAAASDRLQGLGYDERFRRLWNLYLAYSEGGFAERRIQVGQFTLVKPAYVAPPLRVATAPARAFVGAARLG